MPTALEARYKLGRVLLSRTWRLYIQLEEDSPHGGGGEGALGTARKLKIMGAYGGLQGDGLPDHKKEMVHTVYFNFPFQIFYFKMKWLC